VPETPTPKDSWNGIGAGWGAASTLLAGVLFWGGVGWLLDRWIGVGHWFLAIGMIVGAAGGTYAVYVRHGKGKSADR
jgi:F0F1-type ATP synthase assembly protein I